MLEVGQSFEPIRGRLYSLLILGPVQCRVRESSKTRTPLVLPGRYTIIPLLRILPCLGLSGESKQISRKRERGETVSNRLRGRCWVANEMLCEMWGTKSFDPCKTTGNDEASYLFSYMLLGLSPSGKRLGGMTCLLHYRACCSCNTTFWLFKLFHRFAQCLVAWDRGGNVGTLAAA